jgi:hypothetical protein
MMLKNCCQQLQRKRPWIRVLIAKMRIARIQLLNFMKLGLMWMFI